MRWQVNSKYANVIVIASTVSLSQTLMNVINTMEIVHKSVPTPLEVFRVLAILVILQMQMGELVMVWIFSVCYACA